MLINNEKPISRRSFIKIVKSTLITFALTGTGVFAAITAKKRKKQGILEGNEFHLSIDETVVNISGQAVTATTVNQMLPGPTLKWKEGEVVTLHVTNNLSVSSSIHWHGIILPYKMDGVPGISFPGIAPGETFTYRFKVNQSGTYWYHSHSDFQEQTGLYGAIVIEPREPEVVKYDRDYVITLSDWSDEKPESIYRKLKLNSDYYNFKQRTIGDFLVDISEKGFWGAMKSRNMWNTMRMSDRDLSDVSGYTYTFLMNGLNPLSHFRVIFKPGEKVRLRFINSAGMSFFDVRIPGLKLKVISADGNKVVPVSVDEFRIGVAETYDVVVEPTEASAYAIFAQDAARSGYALGSLTTKQSKIAKAPKIDPLQSLTMADMGMNMHGKMNMNKHGDMKMGTMKKAMTVKSKKVIPLTELPMAEGVQTAMKAKSPAYRLDDPGAGLRNNGRRVLTYADLKSLRNTDNDPYPDRQIILHLTGNMKRYMWSINGIQFADAAPLQFKYGERLRITFINDTMMSHPMHLHGLWSDLETSDQGDLVRKHTLVVQPGSKISCRVTVDAKGSWAFHCHMLYHMPGMFRKVVVK